MYQYSGMPGRGLRHSHKMPMPEKLEKDYPAGTVQRRLSGGEDVGCWAGYEAEKYEQTTACLSLGRRTYEKD